MGKKKEKEKKPCKKNRDSDYLFSMLTSICTSPLSRNKTFANYIKYDLYDLGDTILNSMLLSFWNRR